MLIDTALSMSVDLVKTLICLMSKIALMPFQLITEKKTSIEPVCMQVLATVQMVKAIPLGRPLHIGKTMVRLPPF